MGIWHAEARTTAPTGMGRLEGRIRNRAVVLGLAALFAALAAAYFAVNAGENYPEPAVQTSR